VSTDIVMPKLSDTMEEGKILKWLKQVGDAISAGEVIAEVETDKADMELEAVESGVLSAIRVTAGDSAPVGAVIAVVDAEGRTAESPARAAPERKAAIDEGKAAQAEEKKAVARPRAAKPSPAAGESAGPTSHAGDASEVKASAAARALAVERGIDLTTVHGSGPAGRIVSEDVEATSTRSERPAAAPAPGAPVVAERHPLSRMRQSIARRMSDAFRDIPHFAVTAEIDMSEAVRLKAALEKNGTFAVPVTYTHLVLKATACALTRHPRLNASYRDGALEVHAEVNLGMAVAVEDGLIVPVLRRADERSLADLAAEARRLVALTTQGRFASEDLSGGTFTVSNMGMLDIEAFTAVINPPQAAILAIGSIKPRAVVRDGAVVAAHTMFITVSCDHRIIDGVMAGRFLEELKTLLESPIGLVIA
jgi:pyruvate dehydrogenase E2 component (dihydrolipoamide acetyltransferase)